MNYKLSGTVRHEGQGYKVGQEAKLLPQLSLEQKADFIERGLLTPVVIEGAPIDEPADFDEVTSAEIAASYISGTFGIERASDETAEKFVEGLVSDLRAFQSDIGTLETENDSLRSAVFVAETNALVGTKAMTTIFSAGYDSREKLAAADDKSLEALPEVGDATVKKLRAYLAK